MELTDPAGLEPFLSLIDEYEQSFHARDIERFRALHVSDGRFVFFDNHSGCDSDSYDEHERKVAAFFNQGDIVPLTRERVRAFVSGNMACLTAIHRYSSRPRPGIGTTYVLELEHGRC